ncbi:hypothetical protein Bhyg_03758, partial [Pseudolycoriella hygida]
LPVEASDWLNRTVRVDLRTSFTALEEHEKFFLRSENTLHGVDATNGQYPWSVLMIAWEYTGFGLYTGTFCSSSIISKNFALSDIYCALLSESGPPLRLVETFVGGARWEWPFPWSDSIFMRHLWYIEPSAENSPNIVLLQFHQTLTFNPNIQPIRLAAPGNFSYEGWASIFMGFDTLIEPELYPTQQLKFVSSNIPRNEDCNLVGNLADHEICSIEENASEFPDPQGVQGGAWVMYEYNEFDYHATLVGIHHSQYLSIASLPVHFGGLGIRKVSDLALPAFLSSSNH